MNFRSRRAWPARSVPWTHGHGRILLSSKQETRAVDNDGSSNSNGTLKNSDRSSSETIERERERRRNCGRNRPFSTVGGQDSRAKQASSSPVSFFDHQESSSIMGDHWMTSGRSRLRAKQKRGFAWRAQKRASVTRPDAFYNPPPRPSNQPRGDHPSRPKKASECKWGGDGKKGFFSCRVLIVSC
jgi:hypothetical protein